ncbi:MAG: CvpA family protein [Clostridia bacterium]|nr:CvpA family protein [Clostridia bacterium]
MMIAIILDLLVLGIVVGSAILAYKKGFIKTLFSLVGGIAAVVLAVSFSEPVAAWLDAAFVSPAIKSSVLAAVNGSPLTEDYDEALESIDVSDKLREMPEALRSFLESINIDVEDAVSKAEQNKAESAAAREQLISDIVAPISSTISKVIALIGLTILFFALLFVASLLLNAIFKLLPFGKTLNRFGGVLFGVARGILLVMVLGAILYGLGKGNNVISLEDIEHTWILKWINAFNPILNLFQ